MRKLSNYTEFVKDQAIALKVFSMAQYFMSRGYTHINVGIYLFGAEVTIFTHDVNDANNVKREMAKAFDLKTYPVVTDLTDSKRGLFTTTWTTDFHCTDEY